MKIQKCIVSITVERISMFRGNANGGFVDSCPVGGVSDKIFKRIAGQASNAVTGRYMYAANPTVGS